MAENKCSNHIRAPFLAVPQLMLILYLTRYSINASWLISSEARGAAVEAAAAAVASREKAGL